MAWKRLEKVTLRLETVRSEISSPSFSSSPWILGAPQSGLAFAIVRIRWKISRLIGGRPGPLRRDLNFQNSLKPSRCHRMTVSGLTTINGSCQSLQNRASKIQKRRSRLRSRGRFADRFIMATCWRSARFSRARSDVFLNPKSILKISFISVFIMDEDVAGPCQKVNNFKTDRFLRGTVAIGGQCLQTVGNIPLLRATLVGRVHW